MNPDSPRLRAAMALVALEPCVLCGDVGPNSVGAWFTEGDAARRLQAPEGKTRAIFYSLCSDCESRPDTIERIEQRILLAADPPDGVTIFGSDGKPWRPRIVRAAS